MPVVSRAQNRYVRWVDAHPKQAAAEHGMTSKVAEHFIEATHGERVRDLPERVQHKADGGGVGPAQYQPIFRW